MDFPLLNTFKEVISSKIAKFKHGYDYEKSQHRWPSINSALTVMVLAIGVTFQIIEALLTLLSIAWLEYGEFKNIAANKLTLKTGDDYASTMTIGKEHA